MHREGHVGAALLAYAPLGALVNLVGATELAVIGGLATAAVSIVPDYDLRVPGISHRGITHTVYFAGLVGVAVAGIGGVVGWNAEGYAGAVVLSLFGLCIGVIDIGSHILADMLTPMGVDPYLKGESRSFDVVRADNPVANYGLLAIGLVAVGLAAGLRAGVQAIL
jgi:inner membrane protein